MSSSTGFLDNVNRSFDRAAVFTAFPQGLLDEIKAGNSLYRFEFPLRHNDGSISVVTGDAYDIDHAREISIALTSAPGSCLKDGMPLSGTPSRTIVAIPVDP